MKWIVSHTNRPSANLQLFCFAQAGGGASTFFPWGKAAPNWLQISAIQLPGHETRISESLSADWRELVKSISVAISKITKLPYAFFGHSMGALLAYETARNMRSIGFYEPQVLFLSGRNSPTVHPRWPPISQLTNDCFLAELSKRYAGIPDEILQNPEMMEMYLPILRNDIRLVEDYRHAISSPLNCPFFLYYGVSDTLVTLHKISGWRALTNGPAYQREFPGGHLYHITHQSNLLTRLFEDLNNFKNIDVSRRNFIVQDDRMQ